MAKTATLSNDAGDIVKDQYDKAAAALGKRTWAGFLQASGKGFLKGAAIAAVMTVIVLAIFGGDMGLAGHLTVNGLRPTLEQGVASGVGQAMNFLTHAAGLAFMAAGGMIGMKLDYDKHTQHMLTLAEAEAKAKEQELSRSRSQEPQIAPTPEQDNSRSWTAREEERRAQATTQQRGMS